MNTSCGFIALVGRPNVGKSTLVNRILQQKLCITSRKPQTTRHAIRGILTDEYCQMVFVDTPGLHHGQSKEIHKLMNQAAQTAIHDVDVVLFMVDAMRYSDEDAAVLKQIKASQQPCLLVVNKVDKIKDKAQLLPMMEQLKQAHRFAEIIPLSALKNDNIQSLLSALRHYMPEGPFLYDEKQQTDRSERFLCAEHIREKIFRLSGQELPYNTTVEIESFEEASQCIYIHALILVDKESHKRMIIGEKGQKIKEIATQARMDMERLLEKKVHLKCWCKVKSGWSDNLRLLKNLGYGD